MKIEDVEKIEKIEVGAEGVRVTYKNGERKFIGGEDGFNLYRRWNEHVNGGVR